MAMGSYAYINKRSGSVGDDENDIRAIRKCREQSDERVIEGMQMSEKRERERERERAGTHTRLGSDMHRIELNMNEQSIFVKLQRQPYCSSHCMVEHHT